MGERKKGNYMANKMTMAEKEIVLNGLEWLLMIYTTKCIHVASGLYTTLLFMKDKDKYKSFLTKKYIVSNKSFIEWFNCRFIYNGHYWKPFLHTPRIKYLRKHIKKLKKELGYKI